jgi:outer membrane protein assembly factor BamA
VSYQEADNLRGILRLRNGNLLGLGERLDLRFLADAGRTEFDLFMANASLAGSLFGYRLGMRAAEDRPLVYDPYGTELGRADFRELRFLATLQRSLGRDALLEAGLTAGWAEVQEQEDIPFTPEQDSVAKAVGRLVFDTLDNRFWPGRGVRLDGRAEQSLTGLGATRSYWRASFRADAFVPLGRHFILETRLFGGAGQDDRVPVYDLHRVGGPMLVPGRNRDEMWGSWAAAGGLGITLRPSSRWQVTLRGGVGQAWLDREDIRLDQLRVGGSVGVARTTPVGPVSLDLGFGAGKVKVYVALGFQ